MPFFRKIKKNIDHVAIIDMVAIVNMTRAR